MSLEKTTQLFSLVPGDMIVKKDLYSLIVNSKKENSQSWEGSEFRIGNTPQQGINWVGQLPNLKAVIIRTKNNAYGTDGWDDEKKLFNYSFKVRNRHSENGGEINYGEKANQVLLNQTMYGYPILLFSESKKCWLFEGSFYVVQLAEKYVTLEKMSSNEKLPGGVINERYFTEGGANLLTHLKIERSRAAVAALKSCRANICEICQTNFECLYGVKYIEAHHKEPISNKKHRALVGVRDFALLCPNCHRAVHCYMASGLSYEEVKEQIVGRLQKKAPYCRQ